ncbi:MAG: hypothetical protein WCZ90_08310 [Melioribacteraceae bacterium]
MTNEEFDLKLRERIKDALETEHEEFTSESWDRFEAKLLYSERKKRFTSILRIAATILLFAAGGVSLVFVYNRFSSGTSFISKHDAGNSKTMVDSSGKENINAGSLTNSGEQVAPRKTNYVSNSAASKRKKSFTGKAENTIAVNDNVTAQNTLAAKNGTDTLLATNNREAGSKPLVEKADSSLLPVNVNAVAKQDLPPGINELRLSASEKQSKSSVRFGANVSSIVNYDQANNNSKLNVGGGLFVEIPLLKNLVVYSGVSLTNQTINYQNTAEQTLALGKHVKSKDLKLTGLDIPVNLKYRFNIAEADFFVSTGFSSLTFLNESIETKYGVNTLEKGNGVGIMQTVSTEEVETNSLGSFNNFFFAKILNISIGVELPINSRNLLLIEPYLKYSAGPLKSVKAYPSMFGVNLGIVF